MSQNDAASYGYALDVAQAGQLYDIRPNTVESYAAEGAIPFGAGVVAGTDPEKQVKAGAAGVFRGIALFAHTQENPYPQNSEGAHYADKDAVSVMRKGAAWVTPSVDVEADDAAYLTADGEWTNVATDNVDTTGKFRRTADADGLTIVEINLP